MKITSNSPEALRRAAVAQVRAEEPPGARRGAFIRSLGFLPTAEDWGNDSPPALGKQKRIVRGDDPASLFAALVCRWSHKITHDKRDGGRLELVLDHYKLGSVNVALRGKKYEGGEKRVHRIGVQHAAKHAAQEALCRCDLSGAFRFTCRVGIIVTQESDSPLIDAENCDTKALLDCLTNGAKASPGLGIMKDDNPKFVEGVFRRHVKGEIDRVRILILGGADLEAVARAARW